MNYRNRERRRHKRQREEKQRAARKMAGAYWLTPKAWRKRCSHCGHEGSVAYRPRDRKSVCVECVERLGINARESKSWLDGGSKAGATVTVRFVRSSRPSLKPTSIREERSAR